MTVRDKIALFPHSPGVYRYYDAGGNVIYVGKAKDLHKRVAQYFQPPERLTVKTRVLVSKIADAAYTVVDSEADALLLENNLIKQLRPRYNILLKDSKTYPWICVTEEDFPRMYITRRVVKGNRYFGPYSSAGYARELVDFLSESYRIRSCGNRITEESVLEHKFRPCLELHISRCDGCCIGKISKDEYNSRIDEVMSLLKGKVHDIIRHYKTLMQDAASSLEFEKAESYKQRIEALQKHYSKSVVTSAAETDMDVFSLVADVGDAYGNFMRVRGGAIIQSLNLSFRLNIEEDRESVLSEFIAEIESRYGKLKGDIVVPFLPDVELSGVRFIVPVRGDKLSVLELSVKNAKELRDATVKQKEHTDPDSYRNSVMEALGKALGMNVLPRHIECFDNSNIQGTNPVASCVVFRDAKPSKKDYRKFKIKTVIGANDYASMREVVTRRYSRMLVEAPDDLPELVVIDGGRGQLEFAYKALVELGIENRLTVIGLAKRMEEVIRVDDPYPLFIDRNSSALKILQQIRDEAHRFGITFHRSLRSKGQIESALTRIKGVGEKTEQRLLIHYGSVPRIAAQSLEELQSFLGRRDLAERILKELNDDTEI